MFNPVDKDTAPHYTTINSAPNHAEIKEKQTGELASLPVRSASLTPIQEDVVKSLVCCAEACKLTATATAFAGLMLSGYTVAVFAPVGILASYQLYRYLKSDSKKED